MPTYGYRCSNCGHEFEIQQRMSDKALETCPKCQGKLRKILYPVGISFKGSG
ncbi:MAG TPA: FmdB family zinc ribbon protein, partial [Candidatus Dormibacteraeota bacterium]|nr:FmdB family zinc ribbon protein [Candidatus Dormibacteraeota bacterium]